MEKKKIILPSNIHFACACCGECCRKWQVLINQAEADRFSKDDWAKSLETAGLPGAKFVKDGIFYPREEVPPQSAEPGYIKFDSDLKYSLKLCDGDKCVFLTEKNLCHMHAEKDFDYKSHTCKAFPVKPVYLPDGSVQANFSFFCPGVADECNSDISEAAIEKLLEDDNDRAIISDKLRLCDNIEISYKNMLTLNHFIGDFLTDGSNASHHNDAGYEPYGEVWNSLGSSMHFDDRIITAIFFVISICKLAKTIHAKSPQEFDSLFALEIAKKDLLKELMKNCAERAEKTPVKNYAPLILMIFISIHQVSRKEISNFSKASTIIFNMIKCSLDIGSFDFKEFNFSMKFADHSKAVFDLNEPRSAALIERYVSHLIFRKKAFFTSNVLRGFQYIFLYYALVKWYAKSFAAERSASSTEYSDVSRAVRFVEKAFANHSMIISLLESNKKYDSFFDPLFESPSIIKTLVKGKQ
ncbi:MAG TPA: YkgJ family cysteine cluster protein [Candidatus Wallbacteria bacterium]|nr:YkgJ family cysteine cluster protein [Candidatus Wallbacteria bacterium]